MNIIQLLGILNLGFSYVNWVFKKWRTFPSSKIKYFYHTHFYYWWEDILFSTCCQRRWISYSISRRRIVLDSPGRTNYFCLHGIKSLDSKVRFPFVQSQMRVAGFLVELKSATVRFPFQTEATSSPASGQLSLCFSLQSNRPLFVWFPWPWAIWVNTRKQE